MDRVKMVVFWNILTDIIRTPTTMPHVAFPLLKSQVLTMHTKVSSIVISVQISVQVAQCAHGVCAVYRALVHSCPIYLSQCWPKLWVG